MAFSTPPFRTRSVLFFGLFLVCPAQAGEKNTPTAPKSEKADSLDPGDMRFIFEPRLRFTSVDKSNFAEPLTLKALGIQVGFETAISDTLSAVLEVEHIESWDNDIKRSSTYQTYHQDLAYIDTAELNRLQLSYDLRPDTKVTLGRQRIALGNQRFIGNRDWSLNEQTFDALRVVNSSLGALEIDFSYINRANRPFGDEASEPDWTGDTFALNLNHPSPIGTFSSFAYLIDIEEVAGTLSSQTYGGRLTGQKYILGGALHYSASYARQSAYGSSDLDYSADYIAADASFEKKGLFAGVGYESLGGGNAQSFQTPLATQKLFQGWSHQFVLTPSDGLQDLSLKSGYQIKTLGPFKKAKLIANYHDYSAETGGDDFGSEFNLAAAAKWNMVELKVKYANYEAESFAKDTQKAWLQVALGF